MAKTNSFLQRVANWMNEDVFTSSGQSAIAPKPCHDKGMWEGRRLVDRPFIAESLTVVSGDFRRLNGFAKNHSLYMPVTWRQHVEYHLREIDKIEIVGNEQSQSGSVGGAMVGGLLLGGAGLVAGAVAGKTSLVHFSITFTDGKRALLSAQTSVYARIKFEYDGLTPPKVLEVTSGRPRGAARLRRTF